MTIGSIIPPQPAAVGDNRTSGDVVTELSTPFSASNVPRNHPSAELSGASTPRHAFLPSRRVIDDSVAAPAYFADLTYLEPAGRQSEAELRGDSEITLRQALGLHTSGDLQTWLVQD